MKYCICFFILFTKICVIFAQEPHIWDGKKTTYSDEQWREMLGKERYQVMRRKATEHAHLGKYVHTQGNGIYRCAACQLALFDGKEKYDAKNGFPSFKKPIHSKNIYYLEDWSFYFKRYEVLCRGCDSHLGHVFNDGPPPKHLRYCINSITLEYIPVPVERPKKEK